MATYISEADADTYFTTYRLVTSAWDSASSAEKGKALNQATRMIDRLNFQGDKYDADQELQFPRGSDTTIPTDIEEACAECAYSLLDGVDVEYEYENLGNNSMGFANVRSSKNSSMVPEHKAVGIPSSIAWRLLLPYLRDVDAINLMRTS
jgi:hypothetical protein